MTLNRCAAVWPKHTQTATWISVFIVWESLDARLSVSCASCCGPVHSTFCWFWFVNQQLPLGNSTRSCGEVLEFLWYWRVRCTFIAIWTTNPKLFLLLPSAFRQLCHTLTTNRLMTCIWPGIKAHANRKLLLWCRHFEMCRQWQNQSRQTLRPYMNTEHIAVMAPLLSWHHGHKFVIFYLFISVYYLCQAATELCSDLCKKEVCDCFGIVIKALLNAFMLK